MAVSREAREEAVAAESVATPCAAPLSRKAVMHKVALGLISLAVGVSTLWQGVLMLQRNIEARGWQPVAAIVRDKRFDDEVFEPGLYRIAILYDYTVGEVTYTSRRYDTDNVATPGWARKKRVLAEYQPGDVVTAYYNPRLPSRAMLKPEFSYLFMSLFTAGMALVVAGAALSVGGLIETVRARARLRAALAGEGVEPEFDRRAEGLWATGLGLVAVAVAAGFLAAKESAPGSVAIPTAVIVSAVLAVAFVVKAARLTLRHRDLAVMRLAVFPVPLVPNEDARWEVSDPRGRLNDIYHYRVHLVYRIEEPGRSGRAPKHHTKYMEEILALPRTGAVTGALVLPRGPRTVTNAPERRCGWWIRVRVDRARAYFPLPLGG